MEKYISGCTGKMQHTSQGAARSFSKNSKHSKNQEIYRCKNCGNWHTTTMSKIDYKRSLKKIQAKQEASDIKEITLENLVDSIVKAQSIIEDTEAQVKVLKDEIGDRLRGMKVTGTKVGSYYVNRVKRLSITDVGIGQAREYGATKEAIDGGKIKQLVLKGVKIIGAIWTEFISIREAKKNE